MIRVGDDVMMQLRQVCLKSIRKRHRELFLVLGLQPESHNVVLKGADSRQDRLPPGARHRVKELDRPLFLDLR